MFYRIDGVSLVEEQNVIRQVIQFAWDCELIQILREGNVLLLDLGSHQETDQARLASLLHRKVSVGLNPTTRGGWDVVHRFDPNGD